MLHILKLGTRHLLSVELRLFQPNREELYMEFHPQFLIAYQLPISYQKTSL